jgi:hypothetical protein
VKSKRIRRVYLSLEVLAFSPVEFLQTADNPD